MAVTEKTKAIDQAILQIEKQFGKGSIMKLGATGGEKVDAIPSGSIALDLALGIGGYPRGRVVEIYGPEASGKTTLTLHAVSAVQKSGGTAAFIDAEHALDSAWARICGVNIDELLISQPDNGEQALEIIGRRVKVKVVKNKVSPPFRIAELEILAAEGISREGGLIDMGITTGVVDKSGAWINYGKTRIGQGREAAKQFLREHSDVAAEIEQKVRERSGAAALPAAGPDGEED